MDSLLIFLLLIVSMNVVVIWPHCSVLLLFCEVYWHVETTKVVCGCMISNLFCAAIAQLESGHSRKFVFCFYVLYLRSARELGWMVGIPRE